MIPFPDATTTTIFFEMAAGFEDFLCEAFRLELRKKFDLLPQRAEYVMGSVDYALNGVMGWASPEKVTERGEHLFGRTGFFSMLQTVSGTRCTPH